MLMDNADKILVTGGAGFIGSHLVKELLNRNYQVVVFDNLSTGRMENLAEVIDHSEFTFIRGDICDKESLKLAMQKTSSVIHLAALIDVSASVKDPFQTHLINVTGTLNTLQEAAKAKVEKFIFASSTAIYGDVKTLPITEETPSKPISPYAASKSAAESYLTAYNFCYNLETVALRFFNVYGPKNENSPYSGVITTFIKQVSQNQPLTIEGDGEQTRDFIHVKDVARALSVALEIPKIGGEAFNICTGSPTSINLLAKTITEIAGQPLKTHQVQPRTGDIRYSYGDPKKAEERLHFKAKLSLKDGLTTLWETK
jgi:UDP-glucose 4-epimerase